MCARIPLQRKNDGLSPHIVVYIPICFLSASNAFSRRFTFVLCQYICLWSKRTFPYDEIAKRLEMHTTNSSVHKVVATIGISAVLMTATILPAQAKQVPNPKTTASVSVDQTLSAHKSQTASRAQIRLAMKLRVVSAAKSRDSKGRYVPGGTGPWSFDCSGLVYWSWTQIGVKLPHNAASQFRATTRIKAGDLQAGDLVFTGSAKGGINHVGIYIGNGMIIHATNPGASKTNQVRLTSLKAKWLHIKGYGRVKF